jgi:hypothetical protein
MRSSFDGMFVKSNVNPITLIPGDRSDPRRPLVQRVALLCGVVVAVKTAATP